MERASPYVPIEDYALIGNRHTCALVARDGSIDWCCVPHLQSPSVFGALLDARRGGRWSVSPVGEATPSRRYVGPSPVLETTFRTESGVLRVCDFLPIRRGRGSEISRSAHAIVRSVRCMEGEVETEIEWTPRPNYGRDDVDVRWEGGVVWARWGDSSLWVTGLPQNIALSIRDAGAHNRSTLSAGEGFDLICGWGGKPAVPAGYVARAYLEETLLWWEEWSKACTIEEGAEEWRDLVLRSGMVLKLLTYERTGAMAAAPTTSLPEEIGGVRNWDYRYCWVRDASLTTGALVSLGSRREGIAFLQFLENAARQHQDPSRIQVLYGLDGETSLPEYNLGHLDGYRNSRPVRVGNAAAIQRQLDVYGELLDAAADLLRIGASLSDGQWEWLRGVADYVCQVWKQKDRGIWEVRGPEMHFTYSKLMCWVALDRAIGIAKRRGDGRVVDQWRREREAIATMILENAYDPVRGTFVQSFETGVLDASNLRIPLSGFLPATDPRVQGTIDATLADLTEDGLVHRYHTEETPDGVGGGEGAFVICTFWLVDALALSGRLDEAEEIFRGLTARTNDVGLYSEEIDPRTGAFLGNFPQAFSHLGLINSADFLGRAAGAPPTDPAAEALEEPGSAEQTTTVR